MRVLVAYETAHGSTTATAEAVANVLRERGAEVDVIRCRQCASVEGYDACIVGSPVWGGNWLRPARKFVRKHHRTLAQHPTAYFHASGAGGDEKTRGDVIALVEPRLRTCAPEVEPVAVGAFGGIIDFDLYNLPIRLIMRAIVGRAGQRTYGRHDLRDWERIRSWAGEVHELFAARVQAG